MSDRASVRFLYLFCQDLAAMRRFYSELVGLHEVYHAEGDGASVAYDCDGLQFTIFESADARPTADGWARQPGWQGGTRPTISWSIRVPEADFPEVVRRLSAAGVERFQPQPRWCGYWSFPVQDPMGNTVELVLPLEEAPADTRWPG